MSQPFVSSTFEEEKRHLFVETVLRQVLDRMRPVRIDPKRSRTWLLDRVGEEVLLPPFPAEIEDFGLSKFLKGGTGENFFQEVFLPRSPVKLTTLTF